MKKFEGSNYKKVENMRTSDIAKLIKQDFKKEFPGCKISVKSQVYSGGAAIHAYITYLSGQVFSDAFLAYSTDPIVAINYQLFYEYCQNHNLQNKRFTEEAQKIADRLEKIGNSYNYDNSDTQSDYWENHFFYFSGITEHNFLEAEKLEYCKKISKGA